MPNNKKQILARKNLKRDIHSERKDEIIYIVYLSESDNEWKVNIMHKYSCLYINVCLSKAIIF